MCLTSQHFFKTLNYLHLLGLGGMLDGRRYQFLLVHTPRSTKAESTRSKRDDTASVQVRGGCTAELDEDPTGLARPELLHAALLNSRRAVESRALLLVLGIVDDHLAIHQAFYVNVEGRGLDLGVDVIHEEASEATR